MNQEQADIIAKLLEIAMDQQWPRIRREVLEFGYNSAEVVAACEALAKLAGCDSLICPDDFE